jgi:hypothetical protein
MYLDRHRFFAIRAKVDHDPHCCNSKINVKGVHEAEGPALQNAYTSKYTSEEHAWHGVEAIQQ